MGLAKLMRGPEFYYTSMLIGAVFVLVLLILTLANAALNGGF